MNVIFDEHTNLNIFYTVYNNEVSVETHLCYYEGTDLTPVPSDFDLESERKLQAYLEDIVYEALEQEQDDWNTEEAVERSYLKQFYGNAQYD